MEFNDGYDIYRMYLWRFQKRRAEVWNESNLMTRPKEPKLN